MPIPFDTRTIGGCSFPVGIVPGFDTTHVAAYNTQFSGVAVDGSFIDLTGGNLGVKVGAPTAEIDIILGLATTYPSAGNNNVFYPGQVTTNFAGRTFAALFTLNSIAPNQFAIANSDGGGGSGLYVNSELGFGGFGASNVISTTLTCSANVPYFAIVSQNGTTETHFLLMDLRTGKIKTEVVASGNTPAAKTAAVCIGCSNNGNTGPLTGSISAAMYSGSFINIATMRYWAANPWSFWYPDRNDNWIAAQATGAITYGFNQPMLGM